MNSVNTGDYSRRFRRQFVAEKGDCRQKRRLSSKLAIVAKTGEGRRIRLLSPKTATVAEFSDSRRSNSRRFWRQSPSTIVASVDRP